MGLFDDLFGSSSSASNKGTSVSTDVSNQTSKGSTTQNTNQENTTNTNSTTTGSTASNSATTGSNVVSSLDPATQALLKSLLPSVSANASSAGGTSVNAQALQTLATTLANKSGSDASALKDTISADQNSAKLSFQTGEGATAAQTAQAVGSKNNTFSQLVAGKANNDLTTQLAQIASSDTLASQNESLQDLIASVNATGAASTVGATDANTALAPLLSLVGALKGATTTSDTSENTAQTGTSSENTDTNSLESIISKILGTSTTASNNTVNATGATTSTGKQTNDPGLVPSLLSLFS